MVYKHTEQTRKDCIEVLKTQGIWWESDITYSVIIYNSFDESYTRPIATGSFSGNVIKCVAVTPLFEGSGLAQRIINYLLEELYDCGFDNIFLFTKPKKTRFFTELGFHQIAQGGDAVALLEQNPKGLEQFCKNLKQYAKIPVNDLPVSTIIMNCNPFTRGHRYIIEQASQSSSMLYVFIVSEDASAFSTGARIELVRQGTSDLENVVIIEGGDYVISKNTFPSYFLKSEKIVNRSYAQLDATIFAEHIAPALNITRRFVGEEPFCPVTADYNNQLQEILPRYGIELTIIERLAYEMRAISASEVRRLFAVGNFDELTQLVPETTMEYLKSEDAVSVRKALKKSLK